MKIKVRNKKDGRVRESGKGSCQAYNQTVSRLNPKWEKHLKNQLI